MQGDHRFFGGRDSPPHHGYGYGYETGGGYSSAGAYYTNGYPSVPAYDDPLAGRSQHDYPAAINELEFQPSETCPKNYVIFDQTCNKSRVMFHPSLAQKFGSSSYDNCYGTPHAYDAGKSAYRDNEYGTEEYSIRQKEDTDEIDALLSSEDGEEDDVVSTGRTPGYKGGSSPESSCSLMNGARGSKSRSECSRSNGERKKERMKKMVRTLKGIIPGGDQMDTPAVLDEAVRYLKSLKVEVKKLGVRNPDS